MHPVTERGAPFALGAATESARVRARRRDGDRSGPRGRYTVMDMRLAPHFGVPGLEPGSFDREARRLNDELFTLAWAYPKGVRDDLEGRLRGIFGASAQFARAGSALRVETAPVSAARLREVAEALGALETRAFFVEAEARLVAVAFFENPHGDLPRPSSGPLCVGRALVERDEIRAASRATCPCGAEHVALVARKAYAGQETEDLPFACLACGRATLVVVDVPGGAEVHLVQALPEERRGWLSPRASPMEAPP